MVTKDPGTIIEKWSVHDFVHIFDILSDLGLGPELRDDLPDEVSGWIEQWASGGYRVIINWRDTPTRRRFTAAHILGHYIYHRDLLGRGVGDNRSYRAEGTPFPNARIQVRHERQANCVAANILMPRATIARLQASGIHDPRKLAERLGVSEDVMRIRLGLPRRAHTARLFRYVPRSSRQES